VPEEYAPYWSGQTSWNEAKIFLENPREPQQLPPFCTSAALLIFPHANTTETEGHTDPSEALNSAEEPALKGAPDDPAGDTTQEPVAGNHFSNVIRKVGSGAAGVLKQVLVNVATEGAKKSIGLP
jgi:hypothetical protein